MVTLRPPEVAPADLFGELVCAGEIRIGEEARAETVIGLLVRCTSEELRLAPTLPMYRAVVVIDAKQRIKEAHDIGLLRGTLEGCRWLVDEAARTKIDGVLAATHAEVRHTRSESGTAPSVEGGNKFRPGPER